MEEKEIKDLANTIANVILALCVLSAIGVAVYSICGGTYYLFKYLVP